MTDIKIPNVGESVSEVTIAQWFKAVGDTVKKDEPLVELETDKAAQELVAMPSASRIIKENGLDQSAIAGTGRDGRITKGDALSAKANPPASAPAAKAPAAPAAPRDIGPREERVRMSRIRQTIAPAAIWHFGYA